MLLPAAFEAAVEFEQPCLLGVVFFFNKPTFPLRASTEKAAQEEAFVDKFVRVHTVMGFPYFLSYEMAF